MGTNLALSKLFLKCNLRCPTKVTGVITIHITSGEHRVDIVKFHSQLFGSSSGSAVVTQLLLNEETLWEEDPISDHDEIVNEQEEEEPPKKCPKKRQRKNKQQSRVVKRVEGREIANQQVDVQESQDLRSLGMNSVSSSMSSSVVGDPIRQVSSNIAPQFFGFPFVHNQNNVSSQITIDPFAIQMLANQQFLFHGMLNRMIGLQHVNSDIQQFDTNPPNEVYQDPLMGSQEESDTFL